MAEKIKVWFDPEGDFLEVQFSDARGFMRPTVRAAAGEMSYANYLQQLTALSLHAVQEDPGR